MKLFTIQVQINVEADSELDALQRASRMADEFNASMDASGEEHVSITLGSASPCEVQQAECQNCDWRGSVSETGPIRDYSERVEPGEEEPCGECPECGALCHEVDACEQ